MPSLAKPTWLLQEATLLDITNHHLFMPASMPTVTSLPDEQALKSGLRQFLFWKGQLLPSVHENTIFLALLGPDGLKALNVLDVTLALKDICNLSQVAEFYQGANTCFFAMSFTAKEPITQILSHFKYFDNSIVLTITHQPPNQHRFRLLWLPPMFNISRVHHLLNGFSFSHRIKRESIALAGTFFTPTNVIAGTITLEPGGDVNKLPHLIKLPAPHKGCALLSIESRPPFCLKCKEVGHRRPQCTMVKCTLCLKVHFPSSTCGTSSYSAVTSRNVTEYSDDDWLAEITDNSPQIDSIITTIATSDPLPPVSTAHPSVNSTISPVPSNLVQQHAPVSAASNNSQMPALTPFLSTKSDVTTPQLAATKTHLKHHPKPSKVIITEHPPPSTTARSHLITYSTAPSSSTALHSNKISTHDSDHTGCLFGDPNPDNTFSSISNSDSDDFSKMDTSDVITSDHSSRKRKGTHQLKDSPPSTSTSISTVDENSFLQLINSSIPDDEPEPVSHSPLFTQAAHLFGTDDSQTSILEGVCPNATFTPDIIKSLRLLFTQGFTIDIITAFPQILIMRSPEIRKKIKFLIIHQGSFTLADIWNHNRIEAKANFIPPPTGLQHP